MCTVTRKPVWAEETQCAQWVVGACQGNKCYILQCYSLQCYSVWDGYYILQWLGWVFYITVLLWLGWVLHTAVLECLGWLLHILVLQCLGWVFYITVSGVGVTNILVLQCMLGGWYILQCLEWVLQILQCYSVCWVGGTYYSATWYYHAWLVSVLQCVIVFSDAYNTKMLKNAGNWTSGPDFWRNLDQSSPICENLLKWHLALRASVRLSIWYIVHFIYTGWILSCGHCQLLQQCLTMTSYGALSWPVTLLYHDQLHFFIMTSYSALSWPVLTMTSIVLWHCQLKYFTIPSYSDLSWQVTVLYDEKLQWFSMTGYCALP